jgi:hypothetical protein
MASLDVNTWYAVFHQPSNQSIVFQLIPDNNNGSLTMLAPDPNSLNWYWQILAFGSYYYFRNRALGVSKQLDVWQNFEDTDPDNTHPIMADTNVNAPGQQWQMTDTSENGYWFLTTVANGTNAHLDVHNLYPEPFFDTVAENNIGEYWSFSSIAPINDVAFSTGISTTIG